MVIQWEERLCGPYDLKHQRFKALHMPSFPFTTSHSNPGNKHGVFREECGRGACGKEGGLLERENEGKTGRADGSL